MPCPHIKFRHSINTFLPSIQFFSSSLYHLLPITQLVTMKISVAAILSLAVLVPTATADFEVYWTAAAGTGGLVRDWAPYAKEPTCNEVRLSITSRDGY